MPSYKFVLRNAEKRIEFLEAEANMKGIRKITDHPHNTTWAEFYECPSASDPTRTYVVSKSYTGTWGCSCPRWIFARENCKHIKQVQVALAVADTAQAIKALSVSFADLGEKA